MFREMRRIKQQTSEEECIRVLSEAKRGILAVHGEDGYPYTIPLDFVYEDGHVYFHCAKTGHKIDAIRQNDKVSFCVLSDGIQEENDWWFHFVSVVIFGRICEVCEEEEKNHRLRMLGRKYFPTEDMIEPDMAKNAAHASVLDLRIEHMTGKRVREK